MAFLMPAESNLSLWRRSQAEGGKKPLVGKREKRRRGDATTGKWTQINQRRGKINGECGEDRESTSCK